MKRPCRMLSGLLLVLLAAPLVAQVPMLLNYQGRLTDAGGNPKNGMFTMDFAVYDAETGGNQLPSGSPWSETQSVTVTNGVFNVLLGSVTPLPTDLFEGGPSDASGPLRFLEVSVEGETLSPRRRIVSAAYAVRSGDGGGTSWMLVETVSLAGTETTVSLPAPGDGQLFKLILEGVRVLSPNMLYLRFNGDSGPNYNYRYITNAGVATAWGRSRIDLGQGTTSGQIIIDRLGCDQGAPLTFSVANDNLAQTVPVNGQYLGAAGCGWITSFTLGTTGAGMSGKVHVLKLKNE